MFQRLKAILNNHWKPLVFMSLVLGFTGWFLWSYTIFQAYATDVFGKWVIEISFNSFGEGPYELIGFPLIMVFIGVSIYVFIEKWQ
jgi:hypothetical protein